VVRRSQRACGSEEGGVLKDGQCAGDLPAQVSLSLDNIETVFRKAGMTLSNVVRITVFTTDVDAMMGAWNELAKRFAAAGAQPTSTLVGVTAWPSPR
jgi:enamine deaminase RidA (YjgF/YER057c/UK114 family)